MVKIGIVDDEVNAIRVILKYLDRLDLDYKVVFEAGTFQEMMHLSLEHKPDILFLDIHLLDYSGFEAAKLIKEISVIDIIFITAYDQEPILTIEDKKYNCLLKPIDYTEFKKAVVQVTESYIS